MHKLTKDRKKPRSRQLIGQCPNSLRIPSVTMFETRKEPYAPKIKYPRKFKFGSRLNSPTPDPFEIIYKTYDLPKCCTDPTIAESPIQKFLSGGHVFITGATGFMGKILLEKLLVSAPKLEKVYLLCREKKGVDSNERGNKLFIDVVFSRLHKMVPDFQKKIVIINGDCGKIRMGVSDEDYKLITEKVNIIFHGAATVRFDEKIHIATNINVRGTREMLRFARDCKNLKAFLHISTAYSNCALNERKVEEKFYPAPHDYRYLIRLAEESPEKMESMTSSLLGHLPNTYAFTKQVAEDLIRQEGEGLPYAIFRPAIVIPSYKEPITVWTDNIYGPMGYLVGIGLGVLRIIFSKMRNNSNIVPVDLAVNSMIAAAWKAQLNFETKKPGAIYNYISSHRNPTTWDEYRHWLFAYSRKNKWYSSKAIYKPDNYVIVESMEAFKFYHIFLHLIPAYFIDAILIALGKQPILVKVYKKVKKFLVVLEYFSCNEWDFEDYNTEKLWEELDPLDKEIYPSDITDLDWDYYYEVLPLGLRTHIIKDPPETINAAQRRMFWLNLVHWTVVILWWTLITWLLWMAWKLFAQLF